MVCEYLKKQDYANIKSFSSGNECIKTVIAGEKPDIVIQDYYLEDSTGIDVLQAVKKQSKNSEFIFLTANDDMEVAVNSIKYGAFDYIIKDNDVAFKKLVDKINKVSKLILLRRNNKVSKLAMILVLLVLSIIIISGLLLYAFGIIHTD